MVDSYTIDNDVWPELIYMGGTNICVQTRMRLAYLDGDKELIVSVFSNARRIYTNTATLAAFAAVKPALSRCALLIGLDFQTGLNEITALLEEYSDIGRGRR